jgi:myo-inositol 2-dehydrogenase / D-chiro-inositol 1-dehydrogenase
VHLSSACRQYPRGQNCYMNANDDMVVGTKGRSNGKDMGTPGISAYVQEHINMVKSIRGDGPYINQGKLIAESTLTCIMARESAYSGQAITWEQAMNSKLDLQPKAFGYDKKMEPGEVPVPGKYKFV